MRCIRPGCKKIALTGSNYCQEHAPGSHGGGRKKIYKKMAKKATRKAQKKVVLRKVAKNAVRKAIK
jgi:hypothetical protein